MSATVNRCTYDGRAPHDLGRSYWQVPAEGDVLAPGAATVDLCDACHDLWLRRKQGAKE